MPYFNIVTESADSTVVTEYTPVEKNAKSYQTEAQLEAKFIRMLQAQGYEYLHIRHQDALVQNLRAQLQKLNGCTFSDSEWKRQDADELQDRAARFSAALYRQGAVCRGQKRPRLPDDEGI